MSDDDKLQLIVFYNELNLQAVFECRSGMSKAALGFSAQQVFNAALLIALHDAACMKLTREETIEAFTKFVTINATEQRLREWAPTDDAKKQTLKAHPHKGRRS